MVVVSGKVEKRDLASSLQSDSKVGGLALILAITLPIAVALVGLAYFIYWYYHRGASTDHNNSTVTPDGYNFYDTYFNGKDERSRDEKSSHSETSSRTFSDQITVLPALPVPKSLHVKGKSNPFSNQFSSRPSHKFQQPRQSYQPSTFDNYDTYGNCPVPEPPEQELTTKPLAPLCTRLISTPTSAVRSYFNRKSESATFFTPYREPLKSLNLVDKLNDKENIKSSWKTATSKDENDEQETQCFADDRFRKNVHYRRKMLSIRPLKCLPAAQPPPIQSL